LLSDIDTTIDDGDKIIDWQNKFGDTETALKTFDKFANALKKHFGDYTKFNEYNKFEFNDACKFLDNDWTIIISGAKHSKYGVIRICNGENMWMVHISSFVKQPPVLIFYKYINRGMIALKQMFGVNKYYKFDNLKSLPKSISDIVNMIINHTPDEYINDKS
jgi:hypothetical protein